MDKDLNRPSVTKWLFLHALPAVALLFIMSAVIFGIASIIRKPAEPLPSEKILPVVEVISALPQEHTITVQSQGTVEARTQTTLFAEVSGRVESISPALYAGGFFREGDTLATIEKTDYIANLAAAKSRQADANLAYQQEQASSAQAREDWEALNSSGEPSELVLRIPQLERTKANLEAATAAVLSAERDLARTNVEAPYNGRVHRKFIDVGQFANARQSQIASIYSVDTAEVRLGISLNQTHLIRIPENFGEGAGHSTKPAVTIKAVFGGREHSWQGVIDRSEGAVDPQTRLLHLVAQIPNPYRSDSASNRPPLKIGSFVTAEIQGAKINDAFVLPRRALRENDTLYIVRDDRTLEVRKVTPIQKTSEIVVVQGQLEEGDLVCLTPLQYVVNGMEVLLSTDNDEAETPPSETTKNEATPAA